MGNYIEEYVPINDINQYFLHYPAQSDIVILFLHGGPGQSEAPFAYKTRPLQQNYNFVYYDQRGTGKTQLKSKTKPQDITLDHQINDLRITIPYLCKRYATSKIVLLGHSWGSILGIEYIKRYSDTVTAYIGMAQVVNYMKGEKTAFDYCYEQSKKNGNMNIMKKLNKLKNYPYSIKLENPWEVLKFRNIQMKLKVLGYKDGNYKLSLLCMKSPIFSLKDIPIMLTSFKRNRNLMNSILTYDTSEYTHFTIPVYFICGRNDWQVPSVLTEKYYSMIQASDKALYWIENAGHLCDIENPHDYNQALDDICQRL